MSASVALMNIALIFWQAPILVYSAKNGLDILIMGDFGGNDSVIQYFLFIIYIKL